jgi:hypothetical protein
MAESPIFSKLGESIRESTAAGFELLLSDVQLAHTMLDRAAVTQDRASCERNVQNAAHARDTIQHLMSRLNLDESRRTQLEEGIRSLETRLASLGSPST